MMEEISGKLKKNHADRINRYEIQGMELRKLKEQDKEKEGRI